MTRFHLLLAAFVAAALAPCPLAGQPSPLSKQVEISRPQASPWPSLWSYFYGSAAVDLGPQGFAVAWSTDYMITQPGDRDRVSPYAGGVLLDRLGRPRQSFLASTETDGDSGVGPPALARVGANGFVAVYCQSRYAENGRVADIWFRRFRSDGVPFDENSLRLGEAPDDRSDCYPGVAANAQGWFAIAWVRNEMSVLESPKLYLQIFDPAAEPASPEVLLAEPVPEGDSFALGMDAAGNVGLIWQDPDGGVWFAHYDRLGQRLHGPSRLGETGSGNLALAMDAAGGFVATWAAPAPAGTERPLWLRAFRPDGTQSGTPAQVYRSRSFYDPSLARDRFGNVALFWLEGGRPALALSGKSSTEPIVLVRQGPVLLDAPVSRGRDFWDRGGVTLGDDGRILTVWLGLRGSRVRDSILGRLWQARKDADLCLVRGYHFLCNTANDGGTADLRFLFGQSGDRPALGDLDGDGRADACVYRDRRFLCDTAHDGGAAETESAQFSFVPPGAQLLLADVDGEDDGRADPCYRDGSRWVCLVWNQIIGTHAISWTFGTGEDPGVLGDVDGDGRAEACVFGGGRFLCDTGHDGGAAELKLNLRSILAGLQVAAPVLADVDGDGRADPCVYGQGRLLCGIFSPRSRRPVRTLELAFGVAGDVAVLGNIDGF